CYLFLFYFILITWVSRVSDNAGWEAFGKESERDGVTCGGGAGWKRGLYPTMTEVKALEKKSLKRT
ncbi:hypothetical protein HN51_046844, partial [Arachis hypogaea]